MKIRIEATMVNCSEVDVIVDAIYAYIDRYIDRTD